MKLWSGILAAVLAVGMLMGGSPAEAKRMGGGSSFGRQSTNVAPRQAAPPTRNAAPAAGAAAAPKKPWGAMLGGLAAGLGLAWLASSLGLG
ncbi:MAG: Tim44 domain-containing protein, partial [Polaromonas sp.]|nr:Tim44 domain-containing protein [Polaromonas sp.]